MDLDDLQRLTTWGAILFLAIAVVGVLGELLGWWNDIGEMMITVATILGVFLGVVALLINATKGQVRIVTSAVTGHGNKLDHHGVLLTAMDSKLDTVNGKLDTVNGKLDTVNGKLDTVNGKLDVLVVENRRQTDVLVSIRDRL